MSRLAKLSLVAAISILASSCSYVTMQRPDKLDKDMPVCVSNKLAPTIDSVQAAGSGLSFIGSTAAAVSDPTNITTPAAVASAIGSAIGTAIWTASAVSGFKRAQACKEVKVNYFTERQTPPATPRANPPMRNGNRTNGGAGSMGYQDPPNRGQRAEPQRREPERSQPEPDETDTEPSRPEGDSTEHMSLKEAAMHCGTSRRNIWSKIDDGTFSTHRSDAGTMLLAEEVKEECGKEPEVPMD